MSKRARDETEEIIQAALKEDQETKSLQKRGKVKGDKGLTLEELEELEGGTVRESRLGKAQRERAFRRKAGRVGDRPGDERNLEKFEVKTGLAEDDGQKLEPFNMAAEREEGYFDEEGHYIERNAEDGGDKDAWLTSGEAVVMNDAMRRKIEAQKQRAEDADLAPQMSKQQTADHERTIASILRPRESVLQALKRLRGPAAPKTAARKQAKLGSDQGTSRSEAMANVADLASFNKLTECASALMDSGELDVYSMHKEEFTQAADTKAPDEDMDMFGDGDDAGPASKAASTSAAPAAPDQKASGSTVAAGARPQPAANAIPQTVPSQAAPVQDTTDYSTWPIKELRRFLQERGHTVTGTVEKEDLVAQVVAAAAQGPEGDAADAPAGFRFDPASGYYSNPETGMYWDTTSGGFCDSSSGKWYTFDGKQYVEWPVVQST